MPAPTGQVGPEPRRREALARARDQPRDQRPGRHAVVREQRSRSSRSSRSPTTSRASPAPGLRTASPARAARGRSRPRRRARDARRARPGRRRRRAGRRGAGPRARARRRDRRRPPSSRPSVRQTAMSARLPGSSEPMSSRPSTAAPPRVPRRSASRAVMACGAAAAARDEQRLLDLEHQVAALVRGRAVDAEADVHAGVEHLAHRRHAGAEAQVRGGAVRDADAVRREVRDGRRRARCTQCAHQTSSASQPTSIEVLDGRAAVALAAELVLVGRLGEVRVQPQAEAPRERGRLLHQLTRDRERRARRDGDLQQVAVGQRGDALGVGQDLVERLDQRVGRQAAVRGAEIHRAARGDEAQAELARRLQLGLEDAAAPAREDVVVVEHGRAARAARARRGRCAPRRTRPRRRDAPTPDRARRATRRASSPARGRA